MKIQNDNGITIKQLKEFVSGLPEKNEYGDDYEVWIGNFDLTSNVAKSIWPLNGIPGDIIINVEV